MKIALVHMRHANSGGTELFLNQLSKYLAEKGEDVTVICRTHVEPSHPDIKFVRLNPISFGKAHRMWRFAKAVEVHVKNADYDFVYGLGKTWTHDILRIGGGTHAHYLQASGRKRLRLKDRIALKIEQRAMRKGAYRHIVANSHKSAAEIHEAYGVDLQDITVIHNFVDTTRFDRSKYIEQTDKLRMELGLDDSPLFLFLGTGYARKGLKSLLDAFALLSFKANLVIVGRDEHQADYESYARTLGISDSCSFVGSKTNSEVYFSLADCYILPTLYEPFGFTVIEALSCGSPVITTEQCGAKEVLNEDVSTILPKEFEAQDLANAMTKWVNACSDSELRHKCRRLALTMDVKAIMERNYKEILKFKRK